MARQTSAHDEHTTGSGTGPKLSWDDISFFGAALTLAMRQWRTAAKALQDQHSLGQRGPWILGLIAKGQVVSPSDLNGLLRCSRSLITAEVVKLIRAGLVASRKSATDGRQLELRLTPLGEAANKGLGDSLVALMDRRLRGYTRDDMLFCAQLLKDFATPFRCKARL